MPPALESASPASSASRVSRTSSRGDRHAGRWAAIAVISVLVHLAMLDALPDWTLSPSAEQSNDAPIRATLMPPAAAPAAAPAAPAAAPPVPAPRAAAPVRERPTRPARPSPPEFIPESMEPVPEIRVDDISGRPAASRSPPADASLPAGLPAASPETPAPPPVAAPPAAVAPQSARLEYRVVYVDTKTANPIHYYGVGSIDWTIGDGRYRGDLVAAVDFLLFKVNVLASHSEGTIGASGLAPDRYTETPRKRSTVATSFNRDARQTVSFSASPATVPLVPGTQDRLSVLFQIGALLLAADSAAAPTPPAPAPAVGSAVGSTIGTSADAAAVPPAVPAQPAGPAPTAIEIPVAGVRGDVDGWRFDVLGVESIEAAGAPLTTTHLRRAPRTGSGDRTIDVWVATQNGGYPARVLYTEPNGSTIEMTLARIMASAAK